MIPGAFWPGSKRAAHLWRKLPEQLTYCRQQHDQNQGRRQRETCEPFSHTWRTPGTVAIPIDSGNPCGVAAMRLTAGDDFTNGFR